MSLSHYDVFACSMGDNTIHYMGHIKMMVPDVIVVLKREVAANA